MASAEPPSAAAEPVKVGGTSFDVPSRYSVIRACGSGAYGVVASARDSQLRRKVAIKKIISVLKDEVDAKRILREIKLLRHFEHENLISILDIVQPPSRDYEDIYLVSELMETDLHRVIYSSQPLQEQHAQYFLYQILRGMKYVHSANVLHRDLKPSNILLNANCDLKICDFGLARGVLPGASMQLTEYVVTRWYRAPEIMLSCKEYTAAVDVWSIGCIFAEILGRSPLFPGDDYVHQLQLICDSLGTPAESDLAFITSSKALRFMRKMAIKPRVPFAQLFPSASEEGLDLLERMLAFNPADRISVEDALNHPYLAQLHSDDHEPTCAEPFSFDFETGLTRDRIRDLIYDEAMAFAPADDSPAVSARSMSSSTASSRAPSRPGSASASERDDAAGQPAAGGQSGAAPAGPDPDAALAGLKRELTAPGGLVLVKHPRRGAPALKQFFSNEPFAELRWTGRKNTPFDLTGVTEVKTGISTKVLIRTGDARHEERYLSLVGRDRTLDLEAESRQRRDELVAAFRRLIAVDNQGGAS